MCEVHATQKRHVCVGAESVNKKLVIQWFREVNIRVGWSGKIMRKKRRGRYTLGCWAGA